MNSERRRPANPGVAELAQDQLHTGDGALSLLRDCVGIRPGQRLLIVEEPDSAAYYDEDVSRLAARVGREQGARVYTTEAPTSLADGAATAAFIDGLRGFDHVIFFARVGDQLRFSDNADLPPATMCYTLSGRQLESAFGSACHHGLCEVKALIDEAFAEAAEVHVGCPRGTDFLGSVPDQQPVLPDVSLRRFPMLVPRPVSSQGFRGRVVLSGFLTGTGSHFYEPYALMLQDDVVAHVEAGRLRRFEGDVNTVARIEAHYTDIARRYAIDPWCTHSWHAGIHPGCASAADAGTDILRWSGSAFGNPRVLHFHTCGNYAPGEISWTIIDPTIRLDGVPVWEHGRLYPDRLAGGSAVLDRHPRLAALYRRPEQSIGL